MVRRVCSVLGSVCVYKRSGWCSVGSTTLTVSSWYSMSGSVTRDDVVHNTAAQGDGGGQFSVTHVRIGTWTCMQAEILF